MRRDAGRARGAALEETILRAALDELAASGPMGMSIARVAERADVNHSTIYRRWSDLDGLIEAAVNFSAKSIEAKLRPGATLAEDLDCLLEFLLERLDSSSGRALTMLAMSDTHRQLVTSSLESQAILSFAEVVQRAMARGEWKSGQLAVEVPMAAIVGAVMHRLFLERRPVSEQWKRELASLILAGVKPA